MLMVTLTTALCIQLGTIDPLPGTLERAEPVSMTSPDSITSGNLIADLNGDGVMDFLDVSIFIQCLNTGPACAAAAPSESPAAASSRARRRGRVMAGPPYWFMYREVNMGVS